MEERKIRGRFRRRGRSRTFLRCARRWARPDPFPSELRCTGAPGFSASWVWVSPISRETLWS